MKKDNVVIILGLTYLALLVVMLQFGTITGEGRLIDVVMDGIMIVVNN